jgi:hypothetical protein
MPDSTISELSADELADLANRMTKASIALFALRGSGLLSAKEQDAVYANGERPLDAMADMLRGRAIKLIADGAMLAAEDLKTAMNKAQTTLKKIKQAKDAIKMATALVTLGGAVLAGSPKAILAAVKGVKEVVPTQATA